MTTRSRTWRAAAAIAALAALTSLTACGDDDDAADDTEEPAGDSTTSSSAAPTGGEVAVTAIDYGYEGFPEELAAGSTISLRNTSAGEVHEIVAFLVPETETRSTEELLALPEEELGAIFAGPPSMVIVALPGGDGEVVLGSATLSAPGRYVYACFIPLGADPAEYQAAIDSGSEEAPEVDGGPPHFTQGMAGEVTVS